MLKMLHMSFPLTGITPHSKHDRFKGKLLVVNTSLVSAGIVVCGPRSIVRTTATSSLFALGVLSLIKLYSGLLFHSIT